MTNLKAPLASHTVNLDIRWRFQQVSTIHKHYCLVNGATATECQSLIREQVTT